MVRVLRNRTRPSVFSGGSSQTFLSGTLFSTTSPTRNYPSACSDRVGRPVVDGNFDSQQYSGEYPNISGYVTTNPSGANRTVYNNFTTTSMPLSISGMAILPAPAGWTLDLVAGTNPSRPTLNIPELVEDLVDLPRALRNLGNVILNPKSAVKPKGLAGNYLGVQFGWIPLIEDLHKLMEFQKYVVKRNAELNKLYSGKGLRRRLKFGDDSSNVAQVDTLTVFPGATVKFTSSVSIKRKQWATIRWKPTAPPPYHPSDTSNNQFVQRLVIGATPEGMANGLWKVIPWTWMIGWFTNFGKYTLANSWTVPAAHSNMNFMSSAEATWTAGSVTASNAHESSLSCQGTLYKKTHVRVTSSSVLAGVNMPYLDMFRLSILGALFTQRFAGKI